LPWWQLSVCEYLRERIVIEQPVSAADDRIEPQKGTKSTRKKKHKEEKAEARKAEARKAEERKAEERRSIRKKGSFL
jgi:hypothetical protein